MLYGPSEAPLWSTEGNQEQVEQNSCHLTPPRVVCETRGFLCAVQPFSVVDVWNPEKAHLLLCLSGKTTFKAHARLYCTEIHTCKYTRFAWCNRLTHVYLCVRVLWELTCCIRNDCVWQGSLQLGCFLSVKPFWQTVPKNFALGFPLKLCLFNSNTMFVHRVSWNFTCILIHLEVVIHPMSVL